MIRIAVLGANGFIGLRLVESLLLRGAADVYPVVRAPSSYAPLSRFALDGRVADARDVNALREAFRGCDVVVHCAAGDRTVVVGSIEPVYRAAAAAGVRRLVYLSSLTVHGFNPPAGTDEASALSPGHEIEYCNWKIAAEARLGRLRQGGELEVVILRPGIVFGPRSGWVREFATALGKGRAYVIGDGEGVCQSIYVDNLVHAIELASTRSMVDGETFIVGDREKVRWKDLLGPITQAMGRSWEQDVYHVSGAPPPKFTSRVYAHLTSSPLVTSIWKRVPPSLRSATFAVIDRLRNQARSMSAFEAMSGQDIEVTREMTLLQRCENKQSHAKAERLLGYAPPVSFADGIAATRGWLEFAGYRPMDDACWPGRSSGQ